MRGFYIMQGFAKVFVLELAKDYFFIREDQPRERNIEVVKEKYIERVTKETNCKSFSENWPRKAVRKKKTELAKYCFVHEDVCCWIT